MSVLKCRSYRHPKPLKVTVEDNVNRFIVSIANSLNAGTVRSCTFTIPFNLDVFKYLFNDKGTSIPRSSGKTYSLADFDIGDLLPDDWYVLYDKHGNGCSIDFPITITPKIKYGPKCYVKSSDGLVVEKPKLFTEIIHVNLCKKRC